MDDFKFIKLENLLRSYGKVVLAYSGGVDSSFLLYFTAKKLGNDKIVAVTAFSESRTRDELEEAQKFSDKLKVKNIIIRSNEFQNLDFLRNSKERCYFCKKELYSDILKIAKESKIDIVLDGTNYSDISDYRPGSKAANELNVKSPLFETRLTKEDIRAFLKFEGLDFYDKPANPCLATRIPYGKKITLEKIKTVLKCEEFLKNIGFEVVRVRHHGKIAKIEIDDKDYDKMMKKDIRKEITDFFYSTGFFWVSVDLNPYKSGNMNRELSRDNRAKI